VTLEHTLRTLYRNIDSQEVEAFAKAIIQTQQLGSDVSETLARQAEFARSNYRALLDRMIARLNTTLFIPLSLTMLPALLIVFIAPTLSQLTNQLG
jgi:pilus assembly protein TadC